ncbi:MAG: imelysin family protein [Leptospira sp.]|nr:imelysin family protein [Leptospira sp.]
MKNLVSVFLLIMFFSFHCDTNRGNSTARSSVSGYLYSLLNGFDSRKMLENLAGNVILPTYSSLEKATADLHSSTLSYQSAPNISTLLTLRLSWKKARAEMKNAEVIYIGPASDPSSSFYTKLDPWIREVTVCYRGSDCSNTVESYSTSGNFTIENLGAGVKGFSVIEYLIFQDNSGGGSGAASDLSVVSALSGNRLTYLIALTDNLKRNASELRKNWDGSSGNFSSIFSGTGAENSKYTGTADVINDLATQITNTLESIIDRKIGTPAGYSVKAKGVKNPNLVESRFSDNSIDDIQNTLTGIRNIYTGDYNGRIGAGLSEYASFNNPTVDQKILNSMGECSNKISALKQNAFTLRNAIISGSSEIAEVHNCLKNLKTIFTIDFANVTNTSIGIGNSDGD